MSISALIRYCPECSHIGLVLPPHQQCCPDSSRAIMVTADVAEQAYVGFHAGLAMFEVKKKLEKLGLRHEN